ncbi:integrase [Clostridium perfringens]|uniref:integrase n=1 Tax=Clostridium perfringens TaxID=1502 RepID=UPI00232D041F|nr:integrase [Clostridium perfringens]MDB2050387.1 integrase [Clostridium perfringens]
MQINIHQINNLLKQGKSVSEVRSILEVGEKKFQKEIKKLGYKYNQKIKQYELNTTYDKSKTLVTEEPKECRNDMKQDIVLTGDNGMTIDIQDDLKHNIINLASDYNKIQEVLKWFENRSDDESMTQVIEVINDGIKINLPKSEIIRTTVRVNEKVWNKFKKFVEEHKEFNQQDLMAQALEDYMNKFQ